MPSPSSRSSITRAFKALAIAAAGACVTGCPVALLAGVFSWNPLYSDELILQGQVFTAERLGIKVGAVRYFEGTDATGSFSIQQGETLDFDFKYALTLPAATADPPFGEFKFTIKSSRRVAQFLVLAWEDINKNGKFDMDEVRAPEAYQIVKMDGSWFGFRASGSVLVPLASESVILFGDAKKVKSFRFVMPELEEPPILEPEPTPTASA